jgi:ABC-type branched-subunit amino acid transport system ATPase component
MVILLADQGVVAWSEIMDRAYVMIRGEIVGITQDRNTVEALLGMKKDLG